MDPGCIRGGILTVLEILWDYKHNFIYDFRARFGLGLADLGTTVPWDEVVSLVLILVSDPTSWLCTARSKWSHPIDYNWTIQAATYDLLAAVNSKRKPKPWPRPWDDSNKTKQVKPNKNAREILKRAKDGNLNWNSKPSSP